MAVDAPDPRTFKSWEDAFQYPVHAVRSMEEKLHSSAAENQDKLRTLVGASYRELLGTARTIVNVNEQMHRVEAGLVNLETKSNSRLLAKINANFTEFENFCSSRERDHIALGSQVTLLQSTLCSVSRLLQTDRDSLTAAKLLVIARLLLKTLSESGNEFTILEKLRTRLWSQRQRLLRHVDRRLAQSGRQVSDIVKDLSAFSLATSAMPTEVLKHYQYIRLENNTRAVDNDLSAQGATSSSVIGRLRHYLETVKLSREIFPFLLSDSLKTLASQPLVRDKSIHELPELELDVLEGWFTDDIRNFTPWLRHEELDFARASQVINQWAKHGLESFSEYLSVALKSCDLGQTAQTRKQIYEIWLSSKQRSDLSIPTLDGVKKLNASFQARLVEIIRSYFEDLHRLPVEIVGSLEHLGSQSQDAPSLWTESTLAIDISDGAAIFRDAVLTRRSGRSDPLRKIIQVYEKCNTNIVDTRKTLKGMRSIRWDDYLDDEDNESDSDEILAVLLPPNASSGVEAELQTAARTTIDNIENALVKIVRTGNHQSEDGSDTGTVASSGEDASIADSKAASLLRIIRELRSRLPSLLHEQSEACEPQTFGQDSIRLLHERLVAHVMRDLPAFGPSSKLLFSSRPAHLDLWIGTPPSPVQPTPQTFNYLRTAVRSMERTGTDLWSPSLVTLLRRAISVAIHTDVEALLAHTPQTLQRKPTPNAVPDGIGTAATAEAEAEAESEEEEAEIEEQKDASEAPPHDMPDSDAQLTQLLFDVCYVQNALQAAPKEGDKGSKEHGLYGLAGALSRRLELEEPRAERIRKSAMEYWRRTYLLFGLLA